MNEFSWPVRVYYEDTDAGNVVYYANYLKFMERARTEWLRAIGFEQDVLRQQLAVIFVVRSVQIEYLQPARFNDALTASVRVDKIGKTSLSIEQFIRRDSEESILCSGIIRIVCVNAGTFKPVAIPMPIMQKLQNGESV